MTTRAETLVIGFIAPPFTDASAVTLAKRIIMAGERVDILCADLSRVRTRDDSLFELISPLIDHHMMVPAPAFFTDYSATRAFMEHSVALLRARISEYRDVYSRVMWPHSHFVAALAKAEHPQLRWTAEYSDPPLRLADGGVRPSGDVTVDRWMRRILRAVPQEYQRVLLEDRRLTSWTQVLGFALADRIVFTNDQQMAAMLEDKVPAPLAARVRERAEIRPHPTLPRQYYGSPRPGRDDDAHLHIGYFGTFYPNRGGGEFLEAISSLSAAERRGVTLHMFSGGGASLLAAARYLGIGDVVQTHAPLPYLEFLRETDSMDALLVADISTQPFGVPSPFLPSKYSDYRGSSAEIMAVTIPGSPLDQLPARWTAHCGDVRSQRGMLSAAIAARTSSHP